VINVHLLSQFLLLRLIFFYMYNIQYIFKYVYCQVKYFLDHKSDNITKEKYFKKASPLSFQSLHLIPSEVFGGK
jgi:hypothetical protein